MTTKHLKKALYAGSFDPVTSGHLWIIEQAAHMFDSLVVAIGENADKKYSYPLETRLQLLNQVTQKFPNIEVTTFSNQFLIHYARSIHAQYIIRGIRNANDYEYEKSMRYVNSDICQSINTIFLIPPRNVAEISSSLVKGLIGSNGWEQIVRKYVPEAVAQTMIEWEHARYDHQQNN
ncbi:MAG: pantetheine-phosphate adenylyltransferase [Burkholderiales bacterium]|nr:pantetheine-phosphate adenylyltransferase [Burkholderiales bacterium]